MKLPQTHWRDYPDDEYMAHIYRIVFDGDNGRLLMLGSAYIDESADGPTDKIFAVAALFGKDPLWDGLRHEWKKQLRKSKIKYFKNSECVSCDGEFLQLRDRYSSLSDAKLAALYIRSQFEQIIIDSQCKCIGVGIDMADFKRLDGCLEVRKNPAWESNHMVMANIMAIGFVGAFLSDSAREKPSHYPPLFSFVCDDSSQSANIVNAYGVFKSKFPNFATYMNGISSLDDKTIRPLQAADLMAALSREMFIDWLDSGKRDQPVCRIPEAMLGLSCLDEDGMRVILGGGQIQPWVTLKEVRKAIKNESAERR